MMKRKLSIVVAFCLLALFAFSSIANASVYVRGYYRSNGTYVAPHYRSSPNSTYLDNYSYQGNINPYTGSVGTKSYDPIYPSYSSTPSYNYTPNIRTYSSSNYGWVN